MSLPATYRKGTPQSPHFLRPCLRKGAFRRAGDWNRWESGRFENPYTETTWLSAIGRKVSTLSIQLSVTQKAEGVLLREFFDDMAEFGEDQFFHRQADGIF